MIRHKLTTIIASLLISSASALAEPAASFDRQTEDHAEIERFLREAQVVRRGPQVVGEQQAYFATMSDGRNTRAVVIQTVRPYQYQWFRSRDSQFYNAAAYRIDQLVNAGVVPCTVLRRLDGQWASVTIRASDDAHAVRREDGSRAVLFGALVGDARGAFASGFYPTKELIGLDGPIVADKQFRAALAKLSRKQLDRELGELLSGREIRYLLARRDRILARYGVQKSVAASLAN